jgi:hypothetical protein
MPLFLGSERPCRRRSLSRKQPGRTGWITQFRQGSESLLAVQKEALETGAGTTSVRRQLHSVRVGFWFPRVFTPDPELFQLTLSVDIRDGCLLQSILALVLQVTYYFLKIIFAKRKKFIRDLRGVDLTCSHESEVAPEEYNERPISQQSSRP